YRQGIRPDGSGAPNCLSCGIACPVLPDDYACFQPLLPSFSLIAKIGSGGWQEVGIGPKTLQGTGRLLLAVNDSVYWDNSGTWTVSQVVPPVVSNAAPVCPQYSHTVIAGTQLSRTLPCWDPDSGDTITIAQVSGSAF